MMKRLQKLKNLWLLSNRSDSELRELLGMTPDTVDGNQKAQVLSAMTDEEFDKYERETNLGWGKFFNNIRNILK